MSYIAREIQNSAVPPRIARGAPKAVVDVVDAALKMLRIYNNPASLELIKETYALPAFAALNLVEHTGALLGVLTALRDSDEYELRDFIVMHLLPKVDDFLGLFERRPHSHSARLDDATQFTVRTMHKLRMELDMHKHLLAAEDWDRGVNAPHAGDYSHLANPIPHHRDWERNPARMCVKCGGIRPPRSLPKQ